MPSRKQNWRNFDGLFGNPNAFNGRYYNGTRTAEQRRVGAFESYARSANFDKKMADAYKSTGFNKKASEKYAIARYKNLNMTSQGQTMDAKTRSAMKAHYYRQERRAQGLAVG